MQSPKFTFFILILDLEDLVLRCFAMGPWGLWTRVSTFSLQVLPPSSETLAKHPNSLNRTEALLASRIRLHSERTNHLGSERCRGTADFGHLSKSQNFQPDKGNALFQYLKAPADK